MLVSNSRSACRPCALAEGARSVTALFPVHVAYRQRLGYSCCAEAHLKKGREFADSGDSTSAWLMVILLLLLVIYSSAAAACRCVRLSSRPAVLSLGSNKVVTQKP
jgi:hypothetical protein